MKKRILILALVSGDAQAEDYSIYGNTAYGSDGRSCTRIGNQVFCNEGRGMKHMAKALLCLGLVSMGLFGVKTGIQYSGYVLFIGCCTAWRI